MRECTDVSYVAAEGVEFTVQRESVVVEEIKEVELRACRAQFIYDGNFNRIGSQPRGHAPIRLPVKKLRRLLHKRRKVKVFGWKGIRKMSFLTIPPRSQLIHNHYAEVYTPVASLYMNYVYLISCLFDCVAYYAQYSPVWC